MNAMAMSMVMVAGTAMACAQQRTDSAAPRQQPRQQETGQETRRDNQPGRTMERDGRGGQPGMQNGQPGQRQGLIKMHFITADELMDEEVIGKEGNELGDVDDLIVSRGDGTIEYVVLSSGGFLGMGQDKVAVPYRAFKYDAAEEALRLDVAAELLDDDEKTMPAGWVKLETEGWRGDIDKDYMMQIRPIGPEYRDPYADALGSAKRGDIRGKVTNVRRQGIDGYEQVVVEVRTADGATENVILGPTWYVMSRNNAPMRGEEINVNAYRFDREGEPRTVARTARIRNEEVILRNEQGRASWETDGAQGAQSRQSPLVLLSEVMDMDARLGASDAGDIEGAVVELESGRVVMLAVDPADDIVGQEGLRVVPWTVTSIGADGVRIDADRNMMMVAEELPEDVTVYADPSQFQPVYQVFHVDVIQLEPYGRSRGMNNRGMDGERGMEGRRPGMEGRPGRGGQPGQPGGGQPGMSGGEQGMDLWSSRGEIARSLANAEAKTVRGTVEGMRPVTVAGGSRAVAMDVRTEEGVKTVILGPERFIAERPPAIKPGDSVTVNAKKVMLGQEEVMVAADVSPRNGQAIVLWREGRPVWDRE